MNMAVYFCKFLDFISIASLKSRTCLCCHTLKVPQCTEQELSFFEFVTIVYFVTPTLSRNFARCCRSNRYSYAVFSLRLHWPLLRHASNNQICWQKRQRCSARRLHHCDVKASRARFGEPYNEDELQIEFNSFTAPRLGLNTHQHIDWTVGCTCVKPSRYAYASNLIPSAWLQLFKYRVSD